MSNKRKREARKLAEKMGISYQAAWNIGMKTHPPKPKPEAKPPEAKP